MRNMDSVLEFRVLRVLLFRSIFWRLDLEVLTVCCVIFSTQGVLAMKPHFLKINVSELSLWVRINLFQCICFPSLKYAHWFYVLLLKK